MNASRIAQVYRLLNGFYVFVILVCRVIAQDVHVKTGTFLDHRKTNAAGADNRDGFASYFVAEEGEIWMPESPFILASQMLGTPQFASQRPEHEERKLCGGFGQNVSSIRERDLAAVGVGSINVVESDSVLRDYLQGALAGLENLSINLIAERGDQAVDSRS